MDENYMNYMKYRTCVVRELLERHFGCEISKICDDTTKIICPCGCIVFHAYDDTPGFRQNEYTVNCSECFLKRNNNTCKGE